MKSTVDAKAFASALKKIGGLPKTSKTPEFMQVHAMFSEKNCRLTATDLSAWFSVDIPADGDTFAVVFSDTKALARASTHFGGRMTLELDEAAHSFTVACGGKSGKFSALNAAIFPETPQFDALDRYNVRVDELYDRIKSISYATCVSETHPSLAGIHFQDNRVWGIDGQRLAIHESSWLNVSSHFALNAASLSFLREFNKCRGELAVGEKYASVKSKNLLLTMRRMENDSIQIDRLLPKDTGEVYWVDRKQYLDALNYLRDCGGGLRATVVFENGRLILDGKSGSYTASVLTGKDFKVSYAYDLSYMRDALKQFDGRNQVRISAVSATTPIVLSDGLGATALLMPVQVSKKEESKAA